MITRSELRAISENIQSKIEQIKYLNSTNSFENREIYNIKLEVQTIIDYLRMQMKLAKIRESGLKVIKGEIND